MEISLADCARVLRKAKNIILTAHIYPDGDAVGSLLAMYFYLHSLGKPTKIILDDALPHSLKFLPGSELISQYAAGAAANTDLLVALDASDEDRIGQLREVTKNKFLNIDHHLSNTRFGDYSYVDSEAAATGQIIFELLHAERVKFTKEMAVCLFTAIATDCGFFRFANTTAATLRYAAELVEYGAKPNVISEFLTKKTLTSIQTLPHILDSLEIYETASGIKIASLIIKQQILETLRQDTEDFISYPRDIDGIEIAIVYKLIENNEVRVSMRSKTIDVSQIALNFGGGGHARAAGYSINGSLEFAKEQLMTAIDCYAAKNSHSFPGVKK